MSERVILAENIFCGGRFRLFHALNYQSVFHDSPLVLLVMVEHDNCLLIASHCYAKSYI